MSPETFALVDAAVRVHAAKALRQAGFPEQASNIEALRPVVDADSAGGAYEALEAAQGFLESSEMAHSDWVLFWASRAAKCAWRGGSHDERCAVSYAKDAAGGEA